MNMSIGACGIVTAVCLLGTGAAKDADEAHKELKKMEGTWRVVSSQVGDERASSDEVKKRHVTVKGAAMVYFPNSDLNDRREGTIKLDPKTKAFDLTVTFPEPGKMLAIYELKGDDLKIGFGNDGLIRPKGFQIDKENVGWLLVLKREKH